jgi:hypothetical protein
MENTEFKSFIEDGIRYLQCKHCLSEYVKVSTETVAVTCSMCVQRICIKQIPLEEMIPSFKKKELTGRPVGWHWMTEFVDKNGNVFHKGKEQPDLKGTLKPTKIKPPKKRKTLSADEKMFKLARKYKEKKKKR